MKNITVAVDDELYHRARIAAAKQNTTVSALVRVLLKAVVTEEPSREARIEKLFETMDRVKKFSTKGRLTRDQIHDR